ncbi:MAG: formylglycine-generating enzyme family protein [Planctomycetaceae bacterium]
MTLTRWVLPFLFLSFNPATTGLFADVVLFGSGANQFSIDFATIGSSGNPADTTGFPASPYPTGSVGYTYYMSKFEISEEMIVKYNASYGVANNAQITYLARSADKPVTGISWNDAARFVNWLNLLVGSPVAYRFQGSDIDISRWSRRDHRDDWDANNPYRSKRAMFALPTTNEWYKAAYYSPSTGGYYNYGTGTDQSPTAIVSGKGTNTSVYNNSQATGPAAITNAGSVNEYGIMAMSGNVHEWMESAIPSITAADSQPGSARVIRGGSWMSSLDQIDNLHNFSSTPTGTFEHVGFRIISLSSQNFQPTETSVPEPSTCLLLTCVTAYGSIRCRRRAREQKLAAVQN